MKNCKTKCTKFNTKYVATSKLRIVARLIKLFQKVKEYTNIDMRSSKYILYSFIIVTPYYCSKLIIKHIRDRSKVTLDTAQYNCNRFCVRISTEVDHIREV